LEGSSNEESEFERVRFSEYQWRYSELSESSCFVEVRIMEVGHAGERRHGPREVVAKLKVR
jgi:hypothetical protein